jgi:hypothetical protein
VLGRDLSAGELLAFYGYIGYLYDPAVRSGDFTCRCRWRSPAVDRVFETLDTARRSWTRPTPFHLPTVRGDGRVFKQFPSGYDRSSPWLHE